MQHAGYLTLKAKELIGDRFPPWMYTPWGSDIFLFGRLPNHVDRIKNVLYSCDYYCPKSNRDIKRAKKFGFKGEILDIFPGNGGYDTCALRSWWESKPSKRRIILLKGYQGWSGRSLFGLRALELCAKDIQQYTVLIHSASSELIIKAELMSLELGISIKILPHISHNELLRFFGQARVSIGLSISDGVPNSLLESMVMGAFPIESITSCADEWINHGETGLIVPPEDPEIIAKAIRTVLNQDQLIDDAAEKNFQIICNRMEKSVINPKISSLYKDIFKKHRKFPEILIKTKR